MTPGYKPSQATDEGGLWQIMNKAESDLQNSRFVIHDTELHDYLLGVLRRLAPEFQDDMRIYIVRTPYFNANMAPNGMMQVWSGLLLRTQNEAQLAAILGHEFAHYRERHSLQHWRDARDKADFAAFLGAGLAVAGPIGSAAGLMANLAALSSIYAYSRDQERQADAIGVELMAKAGYRPMAASEIWAQLIAEHAVDKSVKEQDLFFASHPAAEERMTTLAKQAKSIVGASEEVYADRYREQLRRVRATFLQDELRLRLYDRALFLLKTMSTAGKEDGEIVFYTGEVFRLRYETGDATRAIDAYQRATAFADCPPEAYRSLGLVQMKEGDRHAADLAFQRYLELSPSASDRDMIHTYIQVQG